MWQHTLVLLVKSGKSFKSIFSSYEDTVLSFLQVPELKSVLEKKKQHSYMANGVGIDMARICSFSESSDGRISLGKKGNYLTEQLLPVENYSL